MAAELPASLTHLICFFSHNDRPDQSKAGAGAGREQGHAQGQGQGNKRGGAKTAQGQTRQGAYQRRTHLDVLQGAKCAASWRRRAEAEALHVCANIAAELQPEAGSCRSGGMIRQQGDA